MNKFAVLVIAIVVILFSTIMEQIATAEVAPGPNVLIRVLKGGLPVVNRQVEIWRFAIRTESDMQVLTSELPAVAITSTDADGLASFSLPIGSYQLPVIRTRGSVPLGMNVYTNSYEVVIPGFGGTEFHSPPYITIPAPVSGRTYKLTINQ